ncbi:MAG TPA: HD domain-containing phosphohydrolase [Solirubrobacteraceae bacterium]|nr:HD domain-containing phosphohydrolase [Solirubrobacteraceae bacterium]
MPELLIVDDDEALRRWEERVVRDQGYSCESVCDAHAVRDHLQRSSYQLALLDLNMPGESGMELLSHIRRSHPDVAVLMVTGEDNTKLAMTAIEHGAYGYLVKPVGAGELLINVANALHRRRLELKNRHLVEHLQASADERSQKLEEALQDLRLSETKVWASQAETIFRLARLVEFRDVETGHHLQRMSLYCEILARETGFPEQRCQLVRLASQLHDIGKVAIPDSILLKHGKLTPEEFEVIKGHSDTGFQMLSGSASEIVQMGAQIALTHHERWDGSGYPRGLAGDDIPEEGRIAAIADVFDALSSDRVYRAAFPVKSAIEMMQDERGRHFDPELFDTFFLALPEIEAVRQAYAD